MLQCFNALLSRDFLSLGSLIEAFPGRRGEQWESRVGVSLYRAAGPSSYLGGLKETSIEFDVAVIQQKADENVAQTCVVLIICFVP
jgi:hypothetical protein